MPLLIKKYVWENVSFYKKDINISGACSAPARGERVAAGPLTRASAKQESLGRSFWEAPYGP